MAGTAVAEQIADDPQVEPGIVDGAGQGRAGQRADIDVAAGQGGNLWRRAPEANGFDFIGIAVVFENVGVREQDRRDVYGAAAKPMRTVSCALTLEIAIALMAATAATAETNCVFI